MTVMTKGSAADTYAHPGNHRQTILIELLEWWPDVFEPDQGGDRETDSRMLSMSPIARDRSYQELDRCLQLMRTQAPPRYARHLSARFLPPQATTRTRTLTTWERTKTGRRTQRTTPTVQTVYPNWVSDTIIRRAIQWLDHTYVGEPFLPRELRGAA